MADEATYSKLKVSDIRKQFPMYGGLNDEQLLILVHKLPEFKDMPASKFFGAIDYDTQREKLLNEAAQGAGKFANFQAGVGTVGQGVQQRLGQVGIGPGVTDAEIREKRALDKRLEQNTPYGESMQILGKATPQVAIPGQGFWGGAAAGAGGGLLEPTTSDESVVQNMLVSGLVGGTVGKVFPHAVSGLKTVGKIGREMFAGPERVVRQMLQDAAGKGPQALQAALQNARDYIAKLGPDSIPLTSAAAAKSPGLAQLEVGARSADPAAFAPGDVAHKGAVLKKTLAATKGGTKQNIEQLREQRAAEWASNWKVAQEVADPAVFAKEMPKFRAALDNAALSTESSNPAVRGVVDAIRGEMDRLGDNFTMGHLQQLRANLNARGKFQPQSAFESAPRDSAAVNSLISEMDNILNKTTNGAWDAVKGGYEASSRGVNAAKGQLRVREKFVDEAGNPVIKAVDPEGQVPEITGERMRRAIKGSTDKAGRETLDATDRATLQEAQDALHAQEVTQRVKSTATAGGGSATDPTRMARERFSKLPIVGKPLQNLGDWLTNVPKREELLAGALRDPEILIRNLETPTLGTHTKNFADDVLERTRIKKLVEQLRDTPGRMPDWWANDETAARALGSATGIDMYGSRR